VEKNGSLKEQCQKSFNKFIILKTTKEVIINMTKSKEQTILELKKERDIAVNNGDYKLSEALTIRIMIEMCD